MILAQPYKRREADGTYRGGPAFYILHGLGQHWLAVIFSILLLVTFGFNAVQSCTVATSDPVWRFYAKEQGVEGLETILSFETRSTRTPRTRWWNACNRRCSSCAAKAMAAARRTRSRAKPGSHAAVAGD